ncbi:MAG: putative toxin-antitoxin system toxin component, PIN family [Anaerolinea sp.]|nr:putative toxin-antitoxin system toxin component, PIN family [Anaerolinea sp.]
MKVVLDANVYVSALLTQRGNAHQILTYWQDKKFDLLVSPEIIAELSRVLRYPHLVRIHKKSDAEIRRFISLMQKYATLVEPTEKIAVSTDETDNRYLECAVDGQADYLVTGDKKHLLLIGAYQGIRIIAPAVFLALIQLDSK